MNGSELLRVVDAIHRDKNIEKEIVFEGIEQAILSAARKHFGEENEIFVHIERENGDATVKVDGADLDADEIGDLLGRIAAQTAKQVMIQKIREAERDALFEEFESYRQQIVTGTVSRNEHGSVTVNLGKVEGILPRGEQIPGETHRVGERVRAVVIDVRKAGSRVRIILSRTHSELVRRLFELEIPEVAEHVIDVRSLAREAGYRSKVAVSCFDSKIDCVGACVGVRGSRIKSIVDELAGERIDIVRWNDSLQVLVPNALQPAEVEDVILCPMLGKVIVLVRDDQLSLAIGKKGQNVRLASKLVGWDIHVMTQERLDEQLESSVGAFSAIPGVSDELAEELVAQGFFSFDDLSVIEPDQLAELGGLSPAECQAIVEYADVESLRIEEEERRARAEGRLLERTQSRESGATAEPDAVPAAESSDAEPSEAAEPETGATGEQADSSDESGGKSEGESDESETNDAAVVDESTQTLPDDSVTDEGDLEAQAPESTESAFEPAADSTPAEEPVADDSKVAAEASGTPNELNNETN